MERLKACSSPTLSMAAVRCVYSARAWRLFVPVSPRPRPMRSASSLLSGALRGSQLPVKGSALASVGKGSLAPSLKQVLLRLVAVAPLKEGYFMGRTVSIPASPPSQLLNCTESLSRPPVNQADTHTVSEEGTTAYSGPSPVSTSTSSQPTQWLGPAMGIGFCGATHCMHSGGGGEGGIGGSEGGGGEGGSSGGAGGSGGDDGGGRGAKHMERLKACSSPQLSTADAP